MRQNKAKTQGTKLTTIILNILFIASLTQLDLHSGRAGRAQHPLRSVDRIVGSVRHYSGRSGRVVIDPDVA